MQQPTKHLKQRVRDLIILYATLCGIVWFYRRVARARGPLVRVIVFHDVHDREWFEHTIGRIAEWFHVISPHDFHAEKFHPDRVNVLITFDDGYASWESAALPVLEENGISGLFFLNSALLDVAHNPDGSALFMREQLRITPREPLTWNGAQKLLAAGHTIGGHTLTHENLAALGDEAIEAEILDDKHAIERHLGVTLTDFAYPFGTRAHVSPVARARARSAGYSHVYTAVSRFADPRATFSIPRTCIEETLTTHEVKRWILGGYDLFDMLKRLCAR